LCSYFTHRRSAQDGMDLRHGVAMRALEGHLLLRHDTLDSLTDAPTILDVGTGTGLWAIDMADMYPMGQVTGTDISPIQATWVRNPPLERSSQLTRHRYLRTAVFWSTTPRSRGKIPRRTISSTFTTCWSILGSPRALHLVEQKVGRHDHGPQ